MLITLNMVKWNERGQMLPRQGEMGGNTSFISKVDEISVIKFDWGSTDLETFWMNQKGHDNTLRSKDYLFSSFIVVNEVLILFLFFIFVLSGVWQIQ